MKRILTSAAVALAAIAAGAQSNSGALLFHQACDAARATFASGSADPNFMARVSLLDDAPAGGHAFHLDTKPLLTYKAAGNIYAQKGTLGFFFRASTPLDETPFPIFRVSYADHSSWDMVWLRIDWNGSGFDAFVTDINLSRTRVSVHADVSPEDWVHLALSWDESKGMRLYVDGKPAASVDGPITLDAGLDQFGPFMRIASPYQVQSAYTFQRGGDIDEIAVFSEALTDAQVATLASGTIPQTAASEPTFKESSEKKAWLHRLGFDDKMPEYLSDAATTVRKIGLNDNYDLKRWWWKANDGIRETTWPGVYNRSSLPGRNDYFQLPDWDCYSTSGWSIRFNVPEDEQWNHVEISGGAWGSLRQEGRTLLRRSKGTDQSSDRLVDGGGKGGCLEFTNEEQETPIGEFGLYNVSAGDAPRGINRLRYVLGTFEGYGNPMLDEMQAFVGGRHAEGERQMMLGLGDNAHKMRPSRNYKDGGKPIVHIVIPSDTRDLGINIPLTMESQMQAVGDLGVMNTPHSRPYTWKGIHGGLDGIRIEIPALDIAPVKNGLIPINVRVKDPLWPLRDMADFSFSVKPGEARVLWLDLRDRILPDDKPIYLTLASGSDGFCAELLEGTSVELVFKDYDEARKEHIEDRFTQVRDCHAMIVEENTSTSRLSKFAQFEADIEDLLKVDPDNLQARRYWQIYHSEQPAPEYRIPSAPAGVPRWAFLQLEVLKRYRSLIEWYIDERQVDYGEFGGGISDDSDLGNYFAGLVLNGVMPEKATASLHRLLDATFANDMLVHGMSKIQTDGLHTYEEGTNIISQMNILERGNPIMAEHLMDAAKSVQERLIGVNSFGHMGFRSDFFSYDKFAEGGVWAISSRREYFHTCPSLLAGRLYGNLTTKAFMLRFAEDLIRRGKAGEDGKLTFPAEYDFLTDETRLWANEFTAPLFWCAWKWTGDKRFKKAFEDAGYIPSMIQDEEKLVKAYEDNIRLFEDYDYINKEGSVWIDRIKINNNTIQETRLGGIAMNRSSHFIPTNPVIWEFADSEDAEKVAIWCTKNQSNSLSFKFFNTKGTPVSLTMRGHEVDGGDWSIEEGGRRSTRRFGRERCLTLTIPAGQEYTVSLNLKGKGRDFAQLPDVGICREDMTFDGNTIHVKVHNIGGSGVKAVKVSLMRDGQELAGTLTAAIPAPTDLTPKTASVQLQIPAGIPVNGCQVVISIPGKPEEIYDSNNIVKL